MGSAQNMLPSIDLRWWHHVIVRVLHEHCIAEEVTDCIKAILITSIYFCLSDPSIPFKLNSRWSPIKTRFAVTIIMAQGQTFKSDAMYLPPPVFSHGCLYVALYLSSSFDNTVLHQNPPVYENVISLFFLGVLITKLKPKIFCHVQFFVKANFIGEKRSFLWIFKYLILLRFSTKSICWVHIFNVAIMCLNT
jgi:hypothetical protein